MTSPMQDQINEAMAEVREYQQKLVAAQREARAATVSVRSKDRTLTVTAGGHGEVRDIKFHSTDYAAMAPAQLAAVLTETIKAAQEQLAAKTRAAFEPYAGFGETLRASMMGGSDVDELVGPFREMLRAPGARAKEEEED